MEINPVQGIEGATVVFRGFPPYKHYEYVAVEGIPFKAEPDDTKHVAPEGTGTKLDFLA